MDSISNLPKQWSLLMRKYGISARSVAKAAKLNLPHFYNVLNMKSSPTLEYAAKVEEALTEIVEAREKLAVSN